MARAANNIPAHLDVALTPVKHRGLLMVAIMGASIVQFLDATIANVAVPHMQTQLGATAESVTWVLTSFIIATAVATPVVGWLADIFGTRRLFLVAVAGFTLASMLCGIAVNLTEMVGFRIMQGIFAAMIGPLSQSIMLDINKPSEHAKSMAIWSMGVMIAPITGPMIGGWLTESFSWRWVFYVNLPVGIPTLIILWWLLPSRPLRPRKLDLSGYVLFALGLGALQLMLDRGQGEDWFQSWEIMIEGAVAVACLWMFAVRMATARNPLFPLGLVGNRNFAATLGFGVVIGIVMIALSALLPPMLQSLFGYTVLDTGIVMAPRGVGVVVSMFIAAKTINHVGARPLIAIGLSICAATLWMMSRWSLAVDWNHIMITGFIQGLGMGLCFMPLNVLAFSTIDPKYRTDGSGLFNMSRSLGASIGISLMTTVLARSLQTSHSDLAAHVTSFNMPAVDLSSADRLGEYGEAALRILDGIINQQAAMIAYINDFWLMALLVAIAVPFIFVTREARPGAHLPVGE